MALRGNFSSNEASGHIVVDGKTVGTTLQCAHCGRHWAMSPGSGRERGFCYRCDGFVCGKKECMKCVPIEAKLDLTEAIARGDEHEAKKIIAAFEGIRPI